MRKLSAAQGRIFTTLLPYMAAVKKRNAELKLKDLINETKRRCVEEIDCVLPNCVGLPNLAGRP